MQIKVKHHKCDMSQKDRDLANDFIKFLEVCKSLEKSNESFEYIGPNGKKYLQRQVAESGLVKQFGKTTKVFKRSECIAVPVLGKHRYLMPLDKNMSAKIAPLAKPYPKRVKQAMVDSLDTAAVHHRPTRSNLTETAENAVIVATSPI